MLYVNAFIFCLLNGKALCQCLIGRRRAFLILSRRCWWQNMLIWPLNNFRDKQFVRLVWLLGVAIILWRISSLKKLWISLRQLKYILTKFSPILKKLHLKSKLGIMSSIIWPLHTCELRSFLVYFNTKLMSFATV